MTVNQNLMNVYRILSIVKDTTRCQESVIHGSYSQNAIMGTYNQVYLTLNPVYFTMLYHWLSIFLTLFYLIFIVSVQRNYYYL